jgi:hypothetical protein
MPVIRYVDLINGNDANDGSTFALRKKTLQSAATGLTGGDTIKVMKSPDPTSLGSCTWSNSTKTVILPEAVTAHINTCEGTTGWTASTNVTMSTDSTASSIRYGSSATTITIATAFTTGKIAYASCATLDLSGFQQISLGFKTSSTIPVNSIYIDLCSDINGDVPVHSFLLPAFAGNTQFTIPLTFDNAANLSSTVRTIAFRAVSDPGAINFTIDHIIACKDKTAANSLTLNSLIGLNTSDEPEWFSIRSINGTTVTLDIFLTNWLGSAGSLTTYKLEPIRLQQILTQLPTSGTSAATGWGSTGSGNTNSYLNFEFGWDTTDMSVQNGVTAFDFQTYIGKGGPDGGDYNYVNKFISVHSYYVFMSGSAIFSLKIGECHNVSAFRFSTSASINLSEKIEFDKFYVTCSNSVNNSYNAPASMVGNLLSFKYNSANVSGSLKLGISAAKFEVITLTAHGFYIGAYFMGTDAKINTYNYKGFSPNASGNTLFNVTNSDLRITTVNGTNVGYDFVINEPNTAISVETLNSDSAWGMYNKVSDYSSILVCVQDYKGTGFAGLTEVLTLYSDTSTVHTPGGKSWKIKCTTSVAYRPVGGSEYYRFQNKKFVDIPVKANKLTTVKLWTRRLYTTSKACIYIAPTISGVSTYSIAESSGAANTWEELTLTFTPTKDGVAELFAAVGYDLINAGQEFYFDDLSVTIAD